MELRFFRDMHRREVDLVLVEEGRPLTFVECKTGERRPPSALRCLKVRFPAAAASRRTVMRGLKATAKAAPTAEALLSYTIVK